MRAGTLVRLACAGTRADRARVTVTALSAALAAAVLLAAANVAAIGPLGGRSDSDRWARHYATELLREPGLRPGVILALLLLAVPVLALAGQAVRLGAPERDRRLAGLRLAGATPGDVTRVAAAEAGLAAAVGTLLGAAAYGVAHATVDARAEVTYLLPPGVAGTVWATTPSGGRPVTIVAGEVVTAGFPPPEVLWLPTDVWPAWWAVCAVVVGVPLVASAATALLLRRVAASPWGVRRRTRTGRPRHWPVAGLLGAVALFGGLLSLARRGAVLPEWLVLGLALAVLLLVVASVVSAAAVVSYQLGRWWSRWARRPAVLLAGRRLLADPWANSRTFTALLAAGLVAGISVGQRELFLLRERAEMADAAAQGSPGSGRDTFYLPSMDLVDTTIGIGAAIALAGLLVAVVEDLVTRRRAHACLVASGVPARVLGASVLLRTLGPLTPVVVLAVAAGFGLQRPFASGYDINGHAVAVPVPWWGLATAVALLVGGAAAAVGAGLVLLRRTTGLHELRVG
ncbi:hypothetical protein GCM10010124_12790 [Pilimelia terevasa]|uniref:FtsX-like permease family protein n=1 Tax=Pilimelia terevasa TaxID=53372 RepID=A0A8J3BHD8_9ACTN|nr:ABC transporter permease [Pilimelia terevasa]GGK21735.1 hypothetical protein GCM10010124_12790 [Pilimelia terevasa]